MSMVDTDQQATPQHDVADAGGLSAEEQAQFDAMRNGTDMPGDPPPQPDVVTGKDTKTPAADGEGKTPPAGEVDDPEVETVKDATGKEVIDTTTGKPQKRVSFHKFKRTEDAKNAIEADLAKEREKNARIDERLKIINEALATPAADPQQKTVEDDPEPDPETEVFEHAKWLGRELKRTKEQLTSFRQQTDTTNEQLQMANTYRVRANEFAKTEPAFAQAYVFLINQRLAELEITNPGPENKALRERTVVAEEQGLVRSALSSGVNPAERLFKMAQGRGFVFKPPVVEPKPGEQKDPKALDSGVTPAAAAAPVATTPTKPKPDVKAEIDAIKNGQQAAQTLSTGGGEAIEQLTQEMLADMPQAQFDELVARLPQSKLRELLGG